MNHEYENMDCEAEAGISDEERKRRIAQASRKSRARKKEEFNFLKKDNERLKQERDLLKAKLLQLQSQVDNKLSTSDLKIIAENSILQLQLGRHREFVSNFLRLTGGAPSTRSAQQSLCKQGAEAAKSYIHALISSSQNNWKRLKPPKSLKKQYKDIIVHYQLLDSGLCREYNDKDVSGVNIKRRLNMRVDWKLRDIDHTEFSDFYWKMLNSADMQKRIYEIDALQVKRFETPDPSTQLLYQINKENKSVVFICTKDDCELAKSTLAVPGESLNTSNGPDVLGKRKGGSLFGNVEARVSAATATLSTLEALRSLNTEVEHEVPSVDQVTSIVIQGVVSYNDTNEGCARCVSVSSYPDDYRIMDFSHDDCFEDSETMSEKFGKVLLGIFSRTSEEILF